MTCGRAAPNHTACGRAERAQACVCAAKSTVPHTCIALSVRPVVHRDIRDRDISSHAIPLLHARMLSRMHKKSELPKSVRFYTPAPARPCVCET